MEATRWASQSTKINSPHIILPHLAKSMHLDTICNLQKFPKQGLLTILLIKLNRIKSKSRRYSRFKINFKMFNKISKKLNLNMNKDSYIICRKEKVN